MAERGKERQHDAGGLEWLEAMGGGRRGNRRGTKVPWENGMEGRSFVRGERERERTRRERVGDSHYP